MAEAAPKSAIPSSEVWIIVGVGVVLIQDIDVRHRRGREACGDNVCWLAVLRVENPVVGRERGTVIEPNVGSLKTDSSTSKSGEYRVPLKIIEDLRSVYIMRHVAVALTLGPVAAAAHDLVRVLNTKQVYTGAVARLVEFDRRPKRSKAEEWPTNSRDVGGALAQLQLCVVVLCMLSVVVLRSKLRAHCL